MKSVQDIEAELAAAKKKEQEETWNTHILESRKFLNPLVGKTLLRHYSNGGFVMFKVTGIKEQYYADREGWYGQFSPKKWFELETTGYINCRVPMSCGSEFRLGINFNNMKKIIINNFTWYFDTESGYLYENLDKSGCKIHQSSQDFTPEETVQIINQLKYQQPMISY